jgi:hypothetical protein
MDIYLHDFVESVKTAINNVLSPFFINGGVHNINGFNINFPVCRIYYDIKELEDDNEYEDPIIGIVGSGIGGGGWRMVSNDTSADLKCIFVDQINYVRLVNVRKVVYVKVKRRFPISDPDGNVVNSSQYADSTWSQLLAVLRTQASAMSTNSLKLIYFTDSPTDVSNEQESLLWGQLNLQVITGYNKE